jgi:hypothetical protein
VSHDGVDAARSGAVADGQSSWLETSIAGPGALSFWWRVSSEPDYDFVRLSIDLAALPGSLSGDSGWRQRIVFVPTGTHAVRWTYAKDASFSGGDDAAWLDSVRFTPGRDLGAALDTPLLTWVSGGGAAWFSEDVVTRDGVDAAQTGAVADGQSSWLRTGIEGPGTLSFWWRVSSEEDYDYLNLVVDGSLAARISGEVDWQQRTQALTTGTHVVEWSYAKDALATDGADAAWLDHVVFTPEWRDDDDDLLPDWWEERYFGSLTNVSGTTDWDGDGYNDASEFGAGTSPTSATSLLRLAIPGDVPWPDGPWVLEWGSVEGKAYRLERSTNLPAGFETVWSNLTATPPVNTYTDTTAVGAGPFLYRLETE